MSLLLDALKRAEQEKLARQGEDASNDAASGHSPAPAGGKGALALELQPVGTPVSRGEDAARGAQLMFEAKTAGDGKRSRAMLWVTLAAIAIVVSSAAAYVWYEIRALSPPSAPLLTRRLPPPPPQPVASGPPPPSVAESPRTPPAATLTPAPVAADAPPAAAAPAPVARRAPAAPEDPVTRLLREAPADNAPAPLKFARTVETPKIPADVSAGYQSLRQGDLGDARRRYEAALAADPSSVDARLGIATVEARAGNRNLANAYYRRVLDIDPRNATALAGLAALAESAAPEAVEARLREEVARFPDSAALQFALGSHYAGQGRWGEAQAAFFEAHRLDPTGADILYNLAVSLDHMSQPRLAADFYRRAVEAARVQPAQFDPAPVRRRIAELSGAR